VDFNIRSGGFEKKLSGNAAMATLSGMSISPREISPLVQKSGDGEWNLEMGDLGDEYA
jgi:hypothetical protein